MTIMTILFVIATALLVSVANAQSVRANNGCKDETVYIFTQTSSGEIGNNFVLAAGASVDLGISSGWIGAINIGTGCNSDGSECTTGGPNWNGVTPFSRAEFNFGPSSVTYDISLIYGYNVGMAISSAYANTSCSVIACTIVSGCPVPGPGNNTCYSSCCSSVDACKDGALPANGGGCIDNAGPGPNSAFYDTTCPDAYAFPDNDGAGGYTPADHVVYTCEDMEMVLTLCPGVTSYC